MIEWHFRPVEFVHLPRTGGTFIWEYIKTLNSNKFVYLQSHLPVKKSKNIQTHYKFGLVRNPFDWYLSHYYYYIQKPEKKVTLLENGSLKGADAGLMGREFITKFPTINHYIDFGIQNKIPNFWFSYIYRQFFCDDKGRLLMDYIGRLENLYDEVDFVMDLNNIKPSLRLRNFQGETNRTFRPKHHYCYNQKSIDTILKIDEHIFKEYGYKY